MIFLRKTLPPRILRGLIAFLPLAKATIWWPEVESNYRHGDFQSPALPTELSGHGHLLLAGSRGTGEALLNRTTQIESRIESV